MRLREITSAMDASFPWVATFIFRIDEFTDLPSGVVTAAILFTAASTSSGVQLLGAPVAVPYDLPRDLTLALILSALCRG